MQRSAPISLVRGRGYYLRNRPIVEVIETNVDEYILFEKMDSYGFWYPVYYKTNFQTNHGIMIYGVSRLSGKTTFSECLAKNEHDLGTFIISFCPKDERPVEGMEYPNIKYGLNNPVYKEAKLNPRLLNEDKWLALMDKFGLNKSAKTVIRDICMELTDEELEISEENIRDKCRERTDREHPEHITPKIAVDIKAFLQDVRDLELLDEEKGLNMFTHFFDYLTNPVEHPHAVIFEFSQDKRNMPIIVVDALDQIIKMKELCKVWKRCSLESEALANAGELTSDEATDRTIDVLLSNRRIRELCEVWGITETKHFTTLDKIADLKILAIFDEAGDADWGVAARGSNPCKRKVESMLSYAAHMNILVVLITQYPRNIDPSFRFNCPDKFVGRLQDDNAIEAVSKICDLPYTTLLSSEEDDGYGIKSLDRGEYLLIRDDRILRLKVVLPKNRSKREESWKYVKEEEHL